MIAEGGQYRLGQLVIRKGVHRVLKFLHHRAGREDVALGIDLAAGVLTVLGLELGKAGGTRGVVPDGAQLGRNGLGLLQLFRNRLLVERRIGVVHRAEENMSGAEIGVLGKVSERVGLGYGSAVLAVELGVDAVEEIVGAAHAVIHLAADVVFGKIGVESLLVRTLAAGGQNIVLQLLCHGGLFLRAQRHVLLGGDGLQRGELADAVLRHLHGVFGKGLLAVRVELVVPVKALAVHGHRVDIVLRLGAHLAQPVEILLPAQVPAVDAADDLLGGVQLPQRVKVQCLDRCALRLALGGGVLLLCRRALLFGSLFGSLLGGQNGLRCGGDGRRGRRSLRALRGDVPHAAAEEQADDQQDDHKSFHVLLSFLIKA